MRTTFIIILVISLLSNFSSCSGQTRKEDKGISGDAQRELNNLLADLKVSRPFYLELTEQIIDTISDENLVLVVFDHLSQKQSGDQTSEYQTVMSWNRSSQAIYMIWILEGEVHNGGYNQYYFNTKGEFYKHLPDALKLVGAHKFADLTMRANDIFEKENKKITKHQDGSLQGFSKSYEDNPLNTLDKEFYQLERTQDLQQLLVNFIRKHKADFVGK
jgi:hypothetical protein